MNYFYLFRLLNVNQIEQGRKITLWLTCWQPIDRLSSRHCFILWARKNFCSGMTFCSPCLPLRLSVSHSPKMAAWAVAASILTATDGRRWLTLRRLSRSVHLLSAAWRGVLENRERNHFNRVRWFWRRDCTQKPGWVYPPREIKDPTFDFSTFESSNKLNSLVVIEQHWIFPAAFL